LVRLPPMSRENHRVRWMPAIGLFASVLLVGYPLSAGPVMLLYSAAGEPQYLEPVLEAVYGPLSALPEPIREPLEKWVAYWDELVP
jgi:hypothetical protein